MASEGLSFEYGICNLNRMISAIGKKTSDITFLSISIMLFMYPTFSLAQTCSDLLTAKPKVSLDRLLLDSSDIEASMLSVANFSDLSDYISGNAPALRLQTAEDLYTRMDHTLDELIKINSAILLAARATIFIDDTKPNIGVEDFNRQRLVSLINKGAAATMSLPAFFTTEARIELVKLFGPNADLLFLKIDKNQELFSHFFLLVSDPRFTTQPSFANSALVLPYILPFDQSIINSEFNRPHLVTEQENLWNSFWSEKVGNLYREFNLLSRIVFNTDYYDNYDYLIENRSRHKKHISNLLDLLQRSIDRYLSDLIEASEVLIESSSRAMRRKEAKDILWHLDIFLDRFESPNTYHFDLILSLEAKVNSGMMWWPRPTRFQNYPFDRLRELRVKLKDKYPQI